MGLDDRGQASIEVLFVMLVLFAIFGIFISLTGTSMDKAQTASLGEARMHGEKIVEAINNVYIRGSGYSINITIPPSPNMTAHVNSPTNFITVVYNGQNIPIKLIAPSVQTMDITSDPSGQNNTIYTIKNINGTVYITKN